ncbi:hypothetical protein SAMN02910358_02146 [Lachnospiraceae bacterium XBB1006]|nr:hypothetical protein SAMN02910358_02146 [Lachnospiraceae bacterium XBB1006]
MFRIIDTSSEIFAAYDGGRFDLEKWKTYMDMLPPGAKKLCLADMEEVVAAGYTWENYFLPVLNAVPEDEADMAKVAESFQKITSDAEEKIRKCFGRVPDVDIILYLGLCNGAGWVTDIDGRRSVLMGIEKIMELGWGDLDHMNGLVLHELGHVYQSQFGVLTRDELQGADKWLWQLFTEGIAMVFEQELVGDANYFHQDKDGWKNWCDDHVCEIAEAFANDRNTMTSENQRYFGDWVSFEGQPDVGYYLGTRFVREILKEDTFDNIICYEIEDVKTKFVNQRGLKL